LMIAQDVMIVSKGILIVGYGTRKGNLEQVLETQAKRLRSRGWENVYVAYFRISSPSIPEAMERIAADGIDEIVAIPYYIAEGKLTKQFIPEKIGIQSEMGVADIKGKKITVYMAPAFGNSFALTNIICDRIADVGGDMDSGMLVLGHGTKHASMANMYTVKLNAERLSSLGYKHVEYAFNEFCEPSIKDALDRLEKSGVKNIVAIPLFIAMGLHLGDEIPEQIGIPPYSDGGDITVNGRKIHVFYTRPMEDDPRLLDNLDRKARHYLGE